MSGLLSRFTTFLPNTTILSNDHNQELNRIVNLLNGTTTNLKTVLKTSDAGDPPLELDQLGAGPIFKGFQGGILKVTLDNSGNLSIANTNPSITFDDTAGTDSKIHHDASVLRLGSTSVDHLSIDVSTGIATFAQIPVLPASDPTTANQAARKSYVDGKKTAFALPFFSEDPSAAAPISLVQFICPDGTAVTLTKGKISYQGGSHTAGGSVEFKFQRRTAASGWTDPTNFGSFVLDDTNDTVAEVYTNDFGDVSLLPGDTIVVFRNASSGTVSERAVSINLIGTQQVF